jgi:hypothetical protein
VPVPTKTGVVRMRAQAPQGLGAGNAAGGPRARRRYAACPGSARTQATGPDQALGRGSICAYSARDGRATRGGDQTRGSNERAAVAIPCSAG